MKHLNTASIFTDLHSTQLQHPNFKPCCDKPCCLLVFQQLHLHNFLQHEIATQINKIYPIGWLICALEQFGKWSPNVTKWCQQIHCAPCHRHPATTVELIVWNLYREVPHKCVLGCAPLKMEKWTLKAGDHWRPNILGFLNWRQMKSMPKLRSSNSRPGVGSLELFQHIHAPGNLSVSRNSLKAQGL